MTFYCGECTTQTSSAAFVGRHSDALLLRRWMDGCHTEVKAVLSSLLHSALAAGATENSGQHYYFQNPAPSLYITLLFMPPCLFAVFVFFTSCSLSLQVLLEK